MGSFRNFMFFSQLCPAVDTFLNSRALPSFTRLYRRLGGGQGRVLSRRSRAKADATLLACAAGTLWPGHPAPLSCNSSFLILTSSFISPPSSHPRLDIGCPTPKIILRHSLAPLRVIGMRPFPRWPVEARHSPHSSFVHSSSFTQA